jgi:predicted P-loop ATPase
MEWGEITDGFEDARAQIEADKARRLALEAAEAEAVAAIRQEPDIVKRAKKLSSEQYISFKDVKLVKNSDGFVTQALMTDENKLAVLKAMFGDDGDKEPMPHHDLFSGRYVDHRRDLMDDHYSVVRWIEAFSAGGLKGVSAKAAREILKEWAKHHKSNDLVVRLEKVIPEWDRKERIRTHLIDFFECADTDLNKDFSEYFWLSLYCRATMPGSLAPTVLSLFGAQGCGKSLFQKRLAQIITGNLEADSVQLNLDGDRLEFLRNITGNSVIASVGEMTGFNRGDLNKIKDFITRPSDMLHYKFEGTFSQMRQFIVIMDGNKYEGLQRDDTGNRRFYPVFCGQLPDDGGKPQWKKDFKVSEEKWAVFETEVWQMLAEAKHWITTRTVVGYESFVRCVEKQVADFSNEQMRLESGTVNDDIVVPYIDAALRDVTLTMVTAKGGGKYVAIKKTDLEQVMDEVAKRRVTMEPRFDMSLTRAMKARGSSDRGPLTVKINGVKSTVSAYRFTQFATEAEFYAALEKRMGINGDDDWLVAEEVKPM